MIAFWKQTERQNSPIDAPHPLTPKTEIPVSSGSSVNLSSEQFPHRTELTVKVEHFNCGN